MIIPIVSFYVPIMYKIFETHQQIWKEIFLIFGFSIERNTTITKNFQAFAPKSFVECMKSFSFNKHLIHGLSKISVSSISSLKL